MNCTSILPRTPSIANHCQRDAGHDGDHLARSFGQTVQWNDDRYIVEGKDTLSRTPYRRVRAR